MESQIEALLEKYMAGNTSLQEEATLKGYFTSGKVAPHLQEYVPLFGYLKLSKEDSYSGKFTFKSEKKKVYSWVGIAASVVVVAGLFFQNNQTQNDLGTYEDPEVAMEKTIEALNMVSRLMNTEKENLVYIKEFDNTKNRILK